MIENQEVDMIENWMSSVRFAKKVDMYHRLWSSSSNQMR